MNLRFSASQASKYHNCHASANLEEAIPGWSFKKKERAQARDAGTAQHEVFENLLLHSVDRLAAAYLLRELADVRGKARTKLIKDQREFLIWWFMKEQSAPPIEHEYLRKLIIDLPAKDGEGMVEFSTPPISIRFLADAVEYVHSLLQDPDAELLTEETVSADWLVTKPNTTVDVLVRVGSKLYVIDLKTGTTPVDAVENEQLLYYAACFWKGEAEITLVIIQPKNLSEWNITYDQLARWMGEVQASEAAILAGDVTFTPGNHCTFCPANPQGRGDKGWPFCPVRIELLYGPQDDTESDELVLLDD